MNEELFRVLIIGNFCSGKSTLTNALLGKKVCPTGVLPTTAVCTEIVYGQDYKMTLYPSNQSEGTVPVLLYGHSTNDIKKYLSFQDDIIGGTLSLYDRAVIECGADILKEGFRFIDSTSFQIGNENRMPIQYVRSADAIIYCINSTNAFCQKDKAVLDEINALGRRDLIIAYTHVDMIKNHENVIERFTTYCINNALKYTELGEKAIHFIDLRSGLESKIAGNVKKLDGSGIVGLEQMLYKMKQKKMKLENEPFVDIAIKKCIKKLEELIETYPNEKHSRQLKDIKRRYHDPELKLAVIGEYNTGKSTFINAMLKKDYLSTENIPTTVIPTYIRWDGKPNTSPTIKIKLANDEKEYGIQKNRALLEKRLGITLNQADDFERITTNNDLIDIVSSVTVSFPTDNRFRNFCLIDTPGVNPGAEESKEHVNITRSVLKEEADATIILFPAHTTGNKSSFEFISENAAHLLNGAAFVITKSDMIDSGKEMGKISKYLQGLVKREYGLEKQTIYTCSAQKALFACENGDASNPFLLKFDSMVEDILNDLGDKRKQIIFTKVTTLMDTILSELRKEQNELSEKLETDMKVLEQYSLKNLEKEYRKIFAQFEKDINMKCQQQKNNVGSKVTLKRVAAYDGVERDLDRIHRIRDLQSYANYDIKIRLNSFEDSIKEGIKADAKEMEGIYSKFSEKVFARMKEYQLRISSKISKGTTNNISEISPGIAMDVSIDGMIGGLGIGALILLFINPVTFVTVLAIAWLVSEALLNSMKNNIKEKVQNGLRDAEDAIVDKWKNALNDAKSKYISSGKNLMNEYEKKYEKIFKNRMEMDAKERNRIQGELTEVNVSLEEIDMMESALFVSSHLDSYSEANRELVIKAAKGDLRSINTIADDYKELYASTKNERYQQCYLQWYACCLLLN